MYVFNVWGPINPSSPGDLLYSFSFLECRRREGSFDISVSVAGTFRTTFPLPSSRRKTQQLKDLTTHTPHFRTPLSISLDTLVEYPLEFTY